MIVAEFVILFQLVENVALLVVLSFLLGLLQPRIQKHTLNRQMLLNGLLFGAFAVIVMLTPIELAPGVLLDGRTLIIAIAAAFYGRRTVLVALIIAIPMRVLLGGVGVVSGIGMMLTSAAIGSMFYEHFQRHSSIKLLLLGLLIGIQRLLWLLILPSDLALSALLESTIPVLIVYPLGTLLLGGLLMRQRHQLKLDETLRMSDLAFRTSLSGVIITDPIGNITSINPAALQIFGYKNDAQLLGKPYTLLLADNWTSFEEDSTRHTFEHTARRASGKTFPITLSIAPAKDPQKTFLGFVLTVNDMSEYKQKEELLVESTVMLVQFAESLKEVHRINTTEYKTLPDLFNDCLKVGSHILDMPTGIVSHVEGDTFQICAVKSHIPDFTPGMELDLSDTYCLVVVKEQSTVTYECVGKMPNMLTHPVYQRYGFESYICAPLFVNQSLYGTLSFFSEQPRQFEQYQIEALELLATSISHALTRRADEEARRESEERYRSVVKVMSNGIVLQYADGTIRASNQSAERILGLTKEQMTGKTSLDPSWQSIHEDGSPFPGEAHPSMVTLKTGQPQFNVMMGIHKPDGELTWISINSQPIIRSGETLPYAVVASFEDITHRKQMETKLTERVYQLQMLHRAETQLNDQLNVEHVLRTGLQIALQTSDAEHGFIGLVDTNSLGLTETIGDYRGQVLTSRFITRLLQTGREGTVLQGEGCATLLKNAQINAQIILPLVSHNQLIGILNLETSRPERFTPTAVETLKLITARLGVALQNAQFYRTTQEQLAELQTLHQQVAYQADHDSLTGLVNRQSFERQFTSATALAARNNERLGVLYIDLDRFKVINDTFGHAVGDSFLREVTHRISQSIGGKGITARLGGDEFAAVLLDITSEGQVEALAAKILQSLQIPLLIDSHELTASASIGISFYPDHGTDAQTLLRKADSALYGCKHAGRNTYSVYQEGEGKTRQLSLEHELRHALDKAELRLYYQPQFDLRYNQIVGVEALIRWQNPHFGFVSPGDFIPIAEESGLIIPIGAWVLEEACRQCYRWHEEGYTNLRVAVNISVMQFKRDDFIQMVEAALTRSGLSPEYLELELTESMLLHTGETTVEKLHTLKRLGIHLSIDDFGTGYSSLSYLQDLPIDILKIDRSFIQHIDSEENESSGQVITRAVIGLAHNLGMQVIAEGIETEVQKAFLDGLGCEMIQGYLLSPPVSPEKITPMLSKRLEIG